MTALVLLCALAAAPEAEAERIRSHLELVETLLRSQPAPTEATQASRLRNLDTLNAYWRAGRFPQNTTVPGARNPIFIDAREVPCAAGALIITSGSPALANRIAATLNEKYLDEMNDPELDAWVSQSGLRFGELRLIQPSYQGQPELGDPSPVPEVADDDAARGRIDQVKAKVGKLKPGSAERRTAATSALWSVLAFKRLGGVPNDRAMITWLLANGANAKARTGGRSMLLQTTDEELQRELIAAGASLTPVERTFDALAKQDCAALEARLADPELLVLSADDSLGLLGYRFWPFPSACVLSVVRSPKLTWSLQTRQSLFAARSTSPEVLTAYFSRWPIEADDQLCPTLDILSRMPGDTGAVIRRALAAYEPKLTLSHDCSVLLDAAVYQGREADLDSFLQTARSLNLAVGHPSVGAFLDPRTTALSPKDLAFIEKLLRAGAKPDQKGRYAPPLVWAAMHDDLKLATLLLAHRADPNSVLLLDDTLRCTPLAAAAARDSVPMAKLLLASGATTARPFLLDGRCAAVEQRHDAGGLTLSAKMRALLPKL